MQLVNYDDHYHYHLVTVYSVHQDFDHVIRTSNEIVRRMRLEAYQWLCPLYPIWNVFLC